MNTSIVEVPSTLGRPAPLEPRFNPRANPPAELTMLSNSSPLTRGRVDNLSEGGAFVATDTLLEVGAQIAIGFRLRTHTEAIHVACEVRWLRKQPSVLEGPAGMGVRFLDLSDADALSIREAVEAHEPMFWE